MTEPAAGDLWRYDYLWRWQAEHGETEGRKSRAVCFVTVIREQPGLTRLLILALTTQPPAKDRLALLVPMSELRRAGLNEEKPVWIILDEFNHDIFERSSSLQPDARIGRFSGSFHKSVIEAFRAGVRARRTRMVGRS